MISRWMETWALDLLTWCVTAPAAREIGLLLRLYPSHSSPIWIKHQWRQVYTLNWCLNRLWIWFRKSNDSKMSCQIPIKWVLDTILTISETRIVSDHYATTELKVSVLNESASLNRSIICSWKNERFKWISWINDQMTHSTPTRGVYIQRWVVTSNIYLSTFFG